MERGQRPVGVKAGGVLRWSNEGFGCGRVDEEGVMTV